jgi:small subunit ribosomal protein S17
MAEKKVPKKKDATPTDDVVAEAIVEEAEAVAEVEAVVEEAAAEEIAEVVAEVEVTEAVVEEAAAEEIAEVVAEVEVTEAVVEEAAAEEIAEVVAEVEEIEAVVEEAAVADVEEIAAAVATPSGPKPKKKRLPRSERRQRSKPKREKPSERKPIVRLEKPDAERGRRQERQGTVVSDAMDKTIVVKVEVVKAHPKYKKVVRRSVKFHAHDERGEAKVGDVVRIVETRPLSKTKHWRLAEIVEAAK